MTDSERPQSVTLARDGGPPARSTPLPSWLNLSGRRFDHEESTAVQRVLATGMLSATWGSEVKELEREFGAMLDLPHVIASSSGTAALHIAVGAVNPEPGDEIITTPISDMGTVIPILAQNAVPVFADVDPHTGNLDPRSVEGLLTSRTRAVIAVHLFGKPADLRALREVCDRHGVALIEDCAQAYLARHERDLVGTVGDIGCFSLQQSKHITAGDGGLTVTRDADLARRMRLFADKGWPRDSGERTTLFLGANYRMTELTAAVSRAQLAKLQQIVDDRRATARAASMMLEGLSGVEVPRDDGDHVYWQYPIVLDPHRVGSAQEWAEALKYEGIPATPGYLPQPLFDTPMLSARKTYGSSGYPLTGRNNPTIDAGYEHCPVATDLVARRLLVIPWNENYSTVDVHDIVFALQKVHSALVRSDLT